MRLIDADKLKQHFAWWHEGGEEADRQAEIFEQIIDVQPTIEERQTGKWVSGDRMAGYPRIPYKTWCVYCSYCGNETPSLLGSDEYDFTAYCPNCGARMEVDDEID